ncbi:MAG: ribosome silencing factor [Elusimicrobiales bacterium]
MKDKRYYRKLAIEAARIINSKKGENIVIFDVESKTGLFFYAIITTALSEPHINAIEEEIVKKFKREFNEYLIHRDGIESKQWKVLDYGGIVIHIMDSSSRDFYAIDRIYFDSKVISWKPKKRIKTKSKK